VRESDQLPIGREPKGEGKSASHEEPEKQGDEELLAFPAPEVGGWVRVVVFAGGRHGRVVVSQRGEPCGAEQDGARGLDAS
jgi:hypothetical protein